jgi:uncharacterized protein
VTWVAAYLAVGTFIGFLSGLLGIGGGLTLVPVLAALYDAQRIAPGNSVHLALGTAMAAVAFTTMSSVRAHHGFGGVDWSIVRRLAPAMVAGALLATSLSSLVPQRALAIAFAVIVYLGATQMLLGRKPASARTLPSGGPLFAIGFAIGIVCGLVSAGGAFLTIPFMLFCGVSMRTAIGTAAALGVPAAVMGTVGYVVSGLHEPGLPPWSVGFVYLPALAAVVCASVLFAPVGARLAHRLPVDSLKRGFSLLLFALATRMIVAYV